MKGGSPHVKTVRSTRAHMTYRKHLASRNLEKKLEDTKRRQNFAGVKTVLKARIARLFCSICGWLKAGCMSVELFCALFGVTRLRQRNLRQQMRRAAKKRPAPTEIVCTKAGQDRFFEIKVLNGSCEFNFHVICPCIKYET